VYGETNVRGERIDWRGISDATHGREQRYERDTCAPAIFYTIYISGDVLFLIEAFVPESFCARYEDVPVLDRYPMLVHVVTDRRFKRAQGSVYCVGEIDVLVYIVVSHFEVADPRTIAHGAVATTTTEA
jgi:hypothetical protein